MRRAVVAILGTAAGTTLLVGLKSGHVLGHAATVATAPPVPGGAAPDTANPVTGPPAHSASAIPSTVAGSAAPAGNGTGPGPTAAAPPAGGGLHSGTFTGPVVSTEFGPVQVRITVSGGVMADVTAVQLPSSHYRSVQINNRAAPILRQEALTAQSGNIDTVSGATTTSVAYRSSLQAALDAARRG